MGKRVFAEDGRSEPMNCKLTERRRSRCFDRATPQLRLKMGRELTSRFRLAILTSCQSDPRVSPWARVWPLLGVKADTSLQCCTSVLNASYIARD